jgi:hypothetical protein
MIHRVSPDSWADRLANVATTTLASGVPFSLTITLTY